MYYYYYFFSLSWSCVTSYLFFFLIASHVCHKSIYTVQNCRLKSLKISCVEESESGNIYMFFFFYKAWIPVFENSIIILNCTFFFFFTYFAKRKTIEEERESAAKKYIYPRKVIKKISKRSLSRYNRGLLIAWNYNTITDSTSRRYKYKLQCNIKIGYLSFSIKRHATLNF